MKREKTLFKIKHTLREQVMKTNARGIKQGENEREREANVNTSESSGLSSRVLSETRAVPSDCSPLGG
eukprot:1328716-Amorphochlora_amoeboformis.AAC.1